MAVFFFALLNIGKKIWRAGTSSTDTNLFERCCCSPEGFSQLLQLCFREREAGYLHFSIQRPGDIKYIPHLLAHAVLTLDTGSPKILSGWDAATTSNQQFIIQTLDEYNFGMRRGKWREIFLEKFLSAIRECVFCPATDPQEIKRRLQKHWKFWE